MVPFSVCVSDDRQRQNLRNESLVECEATLKLLHSTSMNSLPRGSQTFVYSSSFLLHRTGISQILVRKGCTESPGLQTILLRRREREDLCYSH
jgi:hypothetical protein